MGVLLKRLEDLGLGETTYVIYMSDNGGGGGAKHSLKQKIDGTPSILISGRKAPVCPSDPALHGGTVHQGEPKKPEQQDGDGKIGQILDGHIDTVLRTSQPAFKAHETSLH